MIAVWLTTAVAAWFATLAAERAALALGAVARPNPIVPQHVRPVAYLGGLGVLCGLGIGLANSDLPWPPAYAWFGALSFGVLGTVDDLRPLAPVPKFGAQLLVAAVAAATGLGQGLTGQPMVDAAFAVFIVLLLVNAVNFTDVCDGLVATVGAVAMLGLAWLWEAGWAVAASGACAGFLLRNRPPARVFLGDAGSHLIGFLLAVAWVDAVKVKPAAVPEGLLINGVFLFEIVFITAVRITKRLPWWLGSPDHFSLRLQAAGWSRMRVDVVAALATVGLVALAASLPWLGLFAHALAAAAAALAARKLLRHEVQGTKPRVR